MPFKLSFIHSVGHVTSAKRGLEKKANCTRVIFLDAWLSGGFLTGDLIDSKR